jgi:DNA modification methylase
MTSQPISSGRRGPSRPVRDRIVEFRRVRAGDLVPNPRNWRRHPERQRAALRGLLRDIGYADALIAREQDGELVLIDGHLRHSLDPDQVVPVLILDLSEKEADTLLATLDPLSAMAIPDPKPLTQLLDRVQTSNRAVAELLSSIARGAGLPGRKSLTDPDSIPPLVGVPLVRRGELWLLGEHRLLCGDASSERDMARLTAGALVDVLWTDPPYGVSYRGKTKRALRIVGDDANELDTLLPATFRAIDKVLAPGAALYVMHPAGAASLMFGRAFVEAGWRLRQSLVWVKDRMVLGHSDYHYRHEPILYGYKPGGGRWGRGHRGWHGDNRQDSVLEVARPAASRDHPTAKPVALVARCLANSASSGGAVLDPFAGSGSTLIACEQLGLHALLLEIDPAYCDVIIRRWEQHTGEMATLEGR